MVLQVVLQSVYSPASTRPLGFNFVTTPVRPGCTLRGSRPVMRLLRINIHIGLVVVDGKEVMPALLLYGIGALKAPLPALNNCLSVVVAGSPPPFDCISEERSL